MVQTLQTILTMVLPIANIGDLDGDGIVDIAVGGCA